jgi:hypothetical protein
VPGSTGTVTFYIGATKAVQEVAWQSGGINRNDGQPLHLSDTAIDLTITTTSLPDGQVGTFYTRTLAASGGATPYTWSVSAGSPPTGLSLTGNVISGTPTVAETATFTVQVTDAVMATDTQSLSITIGTSAPVGDGGKLIGADDATPTGYSGATYQMLNRFQAVATGTMTEFKVKCNANGTIAYAVYADSSGSPAARLAQQATPQNCIAGWNTLAISSVSITSGTYYWLAIYIATGDIGYSFSGGTRKWKSAATTFPDPFDNTGFGDDSILLYFAGWGGTVATVAPAAPTRACTALTFTFKWNAATGATKYHLQVNTSSGFTGTDMFNAEVGNVLYREVTGLTAGTTYYWRVKAGNTAGWSDWSTPGNTTCN